MSKLMKKLAAIVLALAVVVTFVPATTSTAFAASKPDMKKANVKWDLKNNKTLKFKTNWYELGEKTHTVKMTDFKVTKAKKKGYKKCTFTLTFKRKINPTKKQVRKMGEFAGEWGTIGGSFYYTVVDYKTGKCLEGKNDKNVKVTDSGWEYSDYVKKTGKNGTWIRYPKTSTVKVKIIYPKDYKNLAIGVGGYTFAPYECSTSAEHNTGEDDPLAGTGIGTGAAGGGLMNPGDSEFFGGKVKFSKATELYSNEDKSYAHFMRIKG